METKAETISRIRGLVKGVKTDAFLTDRFLYSLAMKYARIFIARMDDKNQLGRYDSVYQNLPGVELEEVSRIEAGCIDIPGVSCKFKRSKTQLPKILEGSTRGPIIRSVTSIDGSRDVKRTTPKSYINMLKTTSFKYNKTIYYWVRNEYLYFPNLEWDIVDIEAMWEVDITEYLCNSESCCVDRRSERTNIPDKLFAEIEGPVRQELMGTMQIPPDTIIDNKNILR